LITDVALGIIPIAADREKAELVVAVTGNCARR
jgi:hypothetical protein